METPQPQRTSPLSSQLRTKYFLSGGRCIAIMARALSTSERGRYAGIGTATHSSLFLGIVVVRLRYCRPPFPSASETAEERRLRTLEDRYRNELMSEEERLELRDRILKLRKKLEAP